MLRSAHACNFLILILTITGFLRSDARDSLEKDRRLVKVEREDQGQVEKEKAQVHAVVKNSFSHKFLS